MPCLSRVSQGLSHLFSAADTRQNTFDERIRCVSVAKAPEWMSQHKIKNKCQMAERSTQGKHHSLQVHSPLYITQTDTEKKSLGSDHATNRFKHKGLNEAGSPLQQGDFWIFFSYLPIFQYAGYSIEYNTVEPYAMTATTATTHFENLFTYSLRGGSLIQSWCLHNSPYHKNTVLWNPDSN